MDDTGSRVFVVCGRAIEGDALQEAFQSYGEIQGVKMVKDKGVAYVKFDKASAAALAIENLNGAVLNNGRGPKLKVLLAEAPTARGLNQPKAVCEAEISSDPDNTPPRSRLFIVVPKQADAQQIQDDIAKFEDLEYCKTDLISAKGVVFGKFKKSSSALKAMEEITTRGTVAGYKVKCMLAEPKTKRGRVDGSPHHDMFGHMHQAAKLDYGLAHQQLGMPDYASLGGLTGLAGGLGGFNSIGNVNNLAEMQGLGAQVGLNFVSMNALPNASPVSPNNTIGTPQLSKQRLFVVVHKAVPEDMIARLFRKYPGMEYCDLKKDRVTGKSKGYCYINYSTPDSASRAIQQLNGYEFPAHSGHRIKVMYAEPLGVRPPSSVARTTPISMPASSPSPVHTPMTRNISPDIASVTDTMANLSVQRVSSQNGVEELGVERSPAARMPSPVAVAPTVARELMFNV